MSIPGSASPLFFQTAAAAAAAPAFELVKSVRLNEADSAYLSRTFDSNGNRRTFTISCWIKRHELDENNYLMAARDGTNYPNSSIRAVRNSTDGFYFLDQTSSVNNILLQSHTNAIFLDPSAWYHFVVAVDTTQPTASDRVKLYVNGVQVTLDGTFPSQNFDCTVSDNIQHTIGRRTKNTGAYEYGDGYYADYYYVDGAALRPTFFGAYDDSGVWQAKAYSGDVNFDPSYGLSSSDIVSSTGFQSGEGADKVIDSTDPTANRAHTVAGNAGEKITVTFSPAVTVNTSLEIYAYLTVSGDSEERRARVNGGDWFNPTSTADAYHDLGFTGSLSKIEIEYNGSTNSRSMTMRGIRIDGNFVHSGTTGVNGFHLFDFENESTVGHDSSGNNHDFSTSNISTSAGAGNDVLFDVPTNSTTTDTGVGGEVSANYATLNPLEIGSNTTFSNGNLEVVSTNTSGWRSHCSTIAVSSGKYYFEADCSAGSVFSIGIADAADNIKDSYTTDDTPAYAYNYNGKKYSGGTSDDGAAGASFTAGDLIGVAFDLDDGEIEFFKNGTSQGTFYTNVDTTVSYKAVVSTRNSTIKVNFGQRAFAYTAPTGFKCLNTSSLPTPTIADGSDHFDSKLYTGNGASASTTQAITGFSFSPDWLWAKVRTASSGHAIYDTVRAVTQRLSSSQSTVFNNEGYFESFDSNGFTVKGNSNPTNAPSATYVAWAWDAGSSTATNTDGSVTSSVRASQTAGFSIVSYTATGSNLTVGHGLNATPAVIITKDCSAAKDWLVMHESIGVDRFLKLNSTQAKAGPYTNVFTSVSNTTFGTGNDSGINTNGNSRIAYCIAPVLGYSAVGSYTGNGSSLGPFIYTGMRPGFLLVKSSSLTQPWYIFDAARNTFNSLNNFLKPSSNDAEGSASIPAYFNFLSNGFRVKDTNAAFNQSGAEYVYYAVAENPFQANGGLAR